MLGTVTYQKESRSQLPTYTRHRFLNCNKKKKLNPQGTIYSLQKMEGLPLISPKWCNEKLYCLHPFRSGQNMQVLLRQNVCVSIRETFGIIDFSGKGRFQKCRGWKLSPHSCCSEASNICCPASSYYHQVQQ